MSTTHRAPAAAAAACLTGILIAMAASAPAFAAPPAPDALKINEVESSDSSVADFVELINNGASAADIGGYAIRDSDDTHTFTIPVGTTIAAGGYFVADTDSGENGFGLGGADAARVFAPGSSTPVDTYSWPTHATTTYGRCPNGTGAFTTTAGSTRGAANNCTVVVPPAPALAWPGGTAVSTADGVNVFGSNLSGLSYQPSGSRAPGVLWAVRNGPSTLYRLIYDGTKWTPDTANGWGAGKALRYPDGAGDPDAEGVTLVGGDPANGVYVATERNNSVSSVSRPAVLRFDVSSSATTLVAAKDWNLTTDLPALGANAGPEAIVWVPDDVLVAKGLRDELTGAAYDPATYANHGAGLFFVGVEHNGMIYAYALDHTTGARSRVATIASGFANVMGLEFEAEKSRLWAICDDTCNGRAATLDVAQSGANAGRFVVTELYERPTGMPNVNNEGFAITPQKECAAGRKPVFWADDNNTATHALRAGTLDCTVIKAATRLTQRPVSLVRSLLRLRVGYAAVLTSRETGQPVAGATIAFENGSGTSARPAACTAVTDSAGSATCTAPLSTIAQLLGTGSTTARYAGTADYEASTDVARVALF